ncbi:unnamed protein product [Polarella glacialis]|uniref:Squalene synthase n=1 Tax=Polarella glacialis TaxID=89957 RepID=A0A813JZS4_POLGL|nr:unnamed protein product [Polarella glacialis]
MLKDECILVNYMDEASAGKVEFIPCACFMQEVVRLVLECKAHLTSLIISTNMFFVKLWELWIQLQFTTSGHSVPTLGFGFPSDFSSSGVLGSVNHIIAYLFLDSDSLASYVFDLVLSQRVGLRQSFELSLHPCWLFAPAEGLMQDHLSRDLDKYLQRPLLYVDALRPEAIAAGDPKGVKVAQLVHLLPLIMLQQFGSFTMSLVFQLPDPRTQGHFNPTDSCEQQIQLCLYARDRNHAAEGLKAIKQAAEPKWNVNMYTCAELDASRFKFLTRMHYWGVDVKTHGPDALWGEHEIDHILLYRLNPGEKLTVKANPEEVKATRWLSREELKKAMSGDECWSPWFRIIAGKFLDTWWQDLDEAITTDRFVDTSSIHRFDTDKEFHGGAGKAGPHLDAVAKLEAAAKEGGEAKRRKVVLEAEHEDRILGYVGRGKSQMSASSAGGAKQGGYGKVPTHGTAKLDQLMRPLEVCAGLRLKCTGLLENNMKNITDPDVKFCDDFLGKVSRSFAAVIRQLSPDLCIDICIFYLVLRALDTVEDDMTAYKGREKDKEAELISFGAKRLTDANCSIKGVGEGDEATLIENFGVVARVFSQLPEGSRVVIRDITDKMGGGMAEYAAADLGQGTVDVAAYNRYCHMVAGLVGEGLTRIFVARGAESSTLEGQGELVWPFCADPKKQPNNLGLANSMGLFLQKTNIIRDYLEDYVDGRAFWPQTVWKKYTTTDDLGEFARPTAHGAGLRMPVPTGGEILAKGVGVQALRCLNDLVADALECVPDALEYLDRIKTPSIFRFCAIPQVMSIATLVECFDNPKVFTGVVKIRKGLTARLIVACCDGPEAVRSQSNFFTFGLDCQIVGHCCFVQLFSMSCAAW